MIYKQYILGDIATFKYGSMPKKNLISESGYPIYTGYKHVGFYPTYNIEKESVIVIARGVGGTGDVKICPAKTHLTNLSIAFDINESILDKKYFYYKYSLSNLRYLDSGTAQSQITINDLKRIKLELPDIKEQKAIANILSSLDDKIELNNKINKNLEELAQTLYKHWFIDFEFPDENGNPYKSSGGKMIESELGLIPKGWKIVEFKEIFDYQNGFPFKSNEYVESGRYNVITIRNVKDGNLDLSNVSKIDYLPEKLNPEQKLEIGDILISLTGNVGRVCLVSIDNGLLNQRVAKIKNYEYKGFTYFMLRNNNIFNEIVSLGKGSAQQNLSPVEMSKIKLAFPVKENLNIPIFDDYLNMILKNSQENIKLVEMRDLLLPKLMSGEIRMPVEE